MYMCHKLAKNLIVEHGFNQRKLAVKLELPKAYFSEWLNGKRILQSDEVERIRMYFASLNLI